MKKLFSFILMLLCIAGAHAQQMSQAAQAENAQRKPEAVLVIGERVVTDLEKVSIADFIELPCSLQVQYADKDKSFDVVSFQVTVNGMRYDCKGNTVSENVKERMKKSEHVSMIFIQDIRVQMKGGSLLMLPSFVVQFEGVSIKE